eukprot:jgi/Tetstr1/439157/TSEL_027609.t1
MAAADDAAYARKVCLIEALAEEYPAAGEPPDEAADQWSESDIRAWFQQVGVGSKDTATAASVHTAEGGQGSGQQPGGGREQPDVYGSNAERGEEDKEKLAKLQLSNTASAYRTQALADGIPDRPDGLFPQNCPVLAALLADGFVPFQKHLSALDAPNKLVHDSWAVGNSAARAGLDLRYFYRAGAPHGELAGAVVFGEAAKIGGAFDVGVHGGAIETALDEATAELCKAEVAPIATTVEAAFKIKKALEAGVTYRVRCRIREVKGFRVWVIGHIESTNDSQPAAVLATCEAQLIDMGKFLALQKR